ncbi:MAG: DNRLRE domain-containing protein [Verrucomicrobia bacterium]|nr:DNRLRE domain-containing protein [Verrucomicrobiota bacterium]
MNSLSSLAPSLCLLFAVLPVSLPAQVITLTPVSDTALFEQIPDNNLGASQSVAVGNTAAESATRSLMKFDFRNAVPAGSTVTSATLELKVVRTSFLVEPATFQIHRLTADWGEGVKGAGAVTGTGTPATAGEATWNARLSGQSVWAVVGGDFAPEVSASTPVAGDTISFSGANLAADVQRWVNDPDSNFGWLIKDQVEGLTTTARRIGSREHPSAQPKLTVQFESPLRILSSGLKEGKFCLKFMAQGRGYVVQAREVVDSGEWQTVATVPAADVPAEVEICDDAPATGTKFYRVMEQ